VRLIKPVAPALVCPVHVVALLPKVVGFGEQETVTPGVAFKTVSVMALLVLLL
jgi:hypothetical protein